MAHAQYDRRRVVVNLGVAIAAAAVVMSGQRAHAQPGTVLSHQKISDTQGGFTGTLDNKDRFGFSVASLGDLDGDGVGDLAVGALFDDDGGTDRGAVWVLFLDTNGTVKSHQKISDTEGGFTGLLDNGDVFGVSVASLGDLDGDGVGELVVGAIGDDDGGAPLDANRGAVWILFLNTDGTVKAHQKISDTQGNFNGILDDDDRFGKSVAALGDLDGNGVDDLAVGANLDDDGGLNRGAVWILFLNTDGSVKSHQKISDTQGGFTGILDNGDWFGESVASLGDIDGDRVGDLAVGAIFDDDGGVNRGAVWVLFLNTNGTVKSHQKISDTEGGFTGILDDDDFFGGSLGSLGDPDGDGVGDLAVGAEHDADGGEERGALWVLFLNKNGTVKSHQKISDTEGGFTGTLDDGDFFGGSVASLGDLGGDGVGDLAVGAYFDDDGGTDRGAVWVLFLHGETIDFDPPQEFPAFGEATVEAIGSFDAAGNDTADLVVVIPGSIPSGTGNVQVFLNQGNDNKTGDWNGLQAGALIPVGTDPSDITAGFFNDDAFVDLAVSNAGDNQLSILLGDGNGSFIPGPTQDVGQAPSAVASADFNMDENTDLVVANALDNTVWVLFGDGMGGFTKGPMLPAGGTLPLDVDPGDIDNDKDVDIVGINNTVMAKGGPLNGSVFVILNNGDGSFAPAVNYPVGTDPRQLAIADIDGDTFGDVVVVNGADATVSILLNQGDGTFGPAIEIGVGANPRSIDAVDLNGDGDPDLVITADNEAMEPVVQVLANITSGIGEVEFQLPLEFSVNADPNFVANADFNADDLPDIVTANTDDGKTGGSVTVLLNDSPPLPEPCPADFDNSGDVGVKDLLFLLGAWGLCPKQGDCPADFDLSGSVDVKDLLTLLGNWGPCP